jgi:hypothetical protein
VKPIRDVGGPETLEYNPSTGEISYDGGSRRRLEASFETRFEELERKLESALAAEARIAELEAQVKALIEKAPAT